MIKWLLTTCIFFLACRQTTKTGSDPIIHSTAATKQQNPDTGLAPQPTTDLPADQLIVPGESIGKTHLGMEASRLEQLLGKPDMSDAAMGKAWLTWKGKQGDHNNAAELNIYTTYKDSTMQEKTVQQIRTTSPFFSTAGGGRVHAPLASLRRFYPGLKKAAYYSTGGKTIFVYDEQAEGIAFEMAASGDQDCTSIIVHKKGTDVMDVYLALHPDARRY